MHRRGAVALLVACSVAIALTGLSYVGYTRPPPAAALVLPDRPPSGLATFLGAPAPEDAQPAPASAAPERRAAFEARYPAQAAAEPAIGPGGDSWALLIGINEHLGTVADNHASREDAERLRSLLLRSGWSDERILLVTDTDATGDTIREALAWLGRKTGDASTVVFSYSGHTRKWYGADGRIEDEALWPTDDAFVRRAELAEALGEVRSAAFWGYVAACEAAGFDVPGVTGPGRVWTFSSAADEKSYEDPQAGHSVWGAFLLDRGLWRGEDGTSVQEAFAEAAPAARTYTSLQVPHGPQTPVLDDQLGRPFTLDARAARVTPPVG